MERVFKATENLQREDTSGKFSRRNYYENFPRKMFFGFKVFLFEKLATKTKQAKRAVGENRNC